MPYADLPLDPTVLQPVIQVASQVPVSGVYFLLPSDAITLNFFLGNTGQYTALPVEVTYRALWPPQVSSQSVGAGAGDGGPFEATSLGLPLEPVQAGHQQVPSPHPLVRLFNFNGNTPIAVTGPAGGPVVEFATSLQPGLVYERTMTPDPPFNRGFPPDIRQVTPQSSGENRDEQQLQLDKTPKNDLPRFYFTRIGTVDAGPDQWKAYLRDATTKRPISPIRPLSDAPPDGGLLLPTSHVDQKVDALTNAELIVVPPPNSSLPNYIPQHESLSSTLAYPVLPEPVTVSGTIDWSGGGPVSADVVFEATGIYAAGTGETSDGGTTYYLQSFGFEYSNTTQAQADGASYWVTLPRGTYRIVVRPRDIPQSNTTDQSVPAVTVVDEYDTGIGGPAPIPSLAIDSAPKISGTAVVADGRPLSGATVEALPIGCPRVADAAITPNTSPSCMPRYAVTTTASGGEFAFNLDPGDYVLRVEPLDGTRLPWVIEPMSVPPMAQPLVVKIPAPVYRGLEVHDAAQIPVANAIVRMFSLQGPRPAIEVGRAVTDESGRFDMYLDPAVQ
jgi:hypothetical protein